MDTDNKFMSCLGIAVSALVLVVVGALMNGWALSTTWNWFMPALFGLPALALWRAVGVATVFSLFTGTNKISNSSKDSGNKSFGEIFIEGLVKATLTPVLTVFLSYIIYSLAF